MPTSSEPVSYRRCLIKTIQRGAGWQARPFRNAGAVGPVEHGATRDEAISAVKASLDSALLEELSRRTPDGYPTADWVLDAFEQIKVSKQQALMLAAHLAAEDHTLTATQLAQAADYKSYEAANSQYGRLGRCLAEEMEWEPAPSADGKPTWTFALATGCYGDTEGVPKDGEHESPHWRWCMRPQLVEVLRDRALKSV